MPAPGSVFFDAINAVAAAVTALTLADWNGAAVPVYTRKLPVVREGLESLPAVVVAFDEEPEESAASGFEGNRLVTYRIEVGTVLPGNESATDRMDYLTGWRQLVRRLFQLPGTVPMPAGVVDVEAKPRTPYHRAAFNDNFDEHFLSVGVMVNEPAS